jgi:HPt (histidine-containing phosphotransfer) domain-containing protein
MDNRIVVAVDEDISDLIPGFLERKRGDVNGILEAVPRNDYETIRRTSHRIKGEGGSYGFNLMTELGRSLERAAAVHDDQAVTALARELLSYIDCVEVVFQPSPE